MSSGLGVYSTNLLLYFLLFGSGATAAVSTFFLIAKGRETKITTKVFIIGLIIIALSITVYLIVLAMAFGSSHPSATPVPFQ